MPESAARLQRLLTEKLGDCHPADVEQKLDEIQTLRNSALQDDQTRPVFAVLGNETRYRLARVLTVSEEEMCVCELEPIVDVSASAVSHALADLVEAGLLTRRKDGNWRYYQTTELADSLFSTADQLATTNE